MYLTASYFSGYCSEGGADRDRSLSGDSSFSGGMRFRLLRRGVYQQQSTTDQEPVGLSWIPETTTTEISPITIIHGTEVEETMEESSNAPQEEGFLGVPSKTSVSTSGSADTLVPSAPPSPSNLSAVTLVGSTGSGEKCDEIEVQAFQYGKVPTSPLPERVIPKRPPRTIEQQAMSTETVTVSKVQQPMPIVKTIVESKTTEVKTCIIKTPTTISTASTLNLTASTVVTTSIITPAKTTISPPSIGVTFDRYLFTQVFMNFKDI